MTHAELLQRHRAVMPDWLSLYYDRADRDRVRARAAGSPTREGNTYLDFFAGILTNMLGYDVPEVREAVERAARHAGSCTPPRCT